MVNGTIRKLGTLYVTGLKRAIPLKPYGAGADYGYGDVLQYNSVNGDIEIRNTESDVANNIPWVEVVDGNKKLLIADRCLLGNISWDELNTKGLIEGKNVTIDGQLYKLRVLDGGVRRRVAGYNDKYALPLTNEWDRIICNEGCFTGLPLTTDSASILQLWHWNMYSWCSGAYVDDNNVSSGNDKVIRGYMNEKWITSSYYGNSGRSTLIGWRPVLEVINTPPIISDSNRDLGDFVLPLVKQYSVTDDNTILSIVEKINGVVLRSFTCNSGDTLTFDSTSLWDSLYISNVVEIEVTDAWGDISIRRWTFAKLLDPLLDTSSLKGFIDRTELLANEITHQKNTLKDKLISKGIVALDTDKMSSLINKVKDIVLPVKTVVGDTFQVYNPSGYLGGSGNLQGTIIYKELTMFTVGQMRISHQADGNQKSTYYNIIHKLVDKNNNIKSQKEYTIPVNTTITMVSEFDNINPLDKIQIIYVCDTSWSCQTSYIRVTCNIV